MSTESPAPAAKKAKQYVRIVFRDHAGRRFQWWAQKLGPRSYRHVGRDGSWGEDRQDRYFLGEVDTEASAVLNRTYCQLETDTEKF